MKKCVPVICAGLAVMFALSGAANMRAEKVEAAVVETAYKHIVTVSGVGGVNIKPDKATLSLTVQTKETTGPAAQSENAKQVEAVTKAIKAAGVGDSDIVTSNYSLSPVYDYGNRSSDYKITGYTVTTSLSVTVNDVTKVGAVIDAAGQNGSSRIGNVSFGLKDENAAYAQALAAAMTQAVSKAKALAPGKTLDAVEIVESGYRSPVYYESAPTMGAMKSMADSYEPTEIYSSDVSVTAYITVSFGY